MLLPRLTTQDTYGNTIGYCSGCLKPHGYRLDNPDHVLCSYRTRGSYTNTMLYDHELCDACNLARIAELIAVRGFVPFSTLSTDHPAASSRKRAKQQLRRLY